MSYNSELQSNNADLQFILNTINNLPDAGEGSIVGEDLEIVLNEQAELIATLQETLRQKTEGSGGNSGTEDGIIDRSITECSNDRVTSIGNGTFAQCSQLITAIFPNVTVINNNAFYPCVKLTTAIFPKATSIGNYAFRGCSKLVEIEFDSLVTIGTYSFYQCTALTAVNLPLVQNIAGNAFGACSKLETADFPKATNIDASAFYKCSVLTALILRNTNAVCTLSNANAFASTPIDSGAGYVYVPQSLVEEFKSATNWTTYASQIRAIEDYPEICGG